MCEREFEGYGFIERKIERYWRLRVQIMREKYLGFRD